MSLIKNDYILIEPLNDEILFEFNDEDDVYFNQENIQFKNRVHRLTLYKKFGTFLSAQLKNNKEEIKSYGLFKLLMIDSILKKLK